MKTYSVEIAGFWSITINVEADDKDQAEKKAWELYDEKGKLAGDFCQDVQSVGVDECK